MSEFNYRKSHSWSWLLALISVTAVSFAIFFGCYLFDAASDPAMSIAKAILNGQASNVMANMTEVVPGLLGITITVVAIVAELASNRYTPRVTELFVRSPVNLAVLGFFVVSGLLCVWVTFIGVPPDSSPRFETAAVIVSITVCMLILLPYFAYVFAFLNPHNIVERMGHASLAAVATGQTPGHPKMQRAKSLAVQGVEQLAEVALNSIEHKDKGICMHAVDALGGIARDYLDLKPRMSADWFRLEEQLKENPDFVSMQREILDGIETGRFWFEMKILRQYQMLYGETLNRMRDLNYLIAINTRKLAQKAHQTGDRQIAILATKFFHTFLRATINERDVRTAYNVLNQYRLIAEDDLRAGRFESAVDAARKFKYYGQLGFGLGQPFVLETAAYDLCTLNELAFDIGAPCVEQMLAIFLEVDKEAAEGQDLDASLRGVRKAQIKLATYYLTHGAEALARTIYQDMRSELPRRLSSIRQELEGIASREFWEISDRGANFDYLEPARRVMLDKFFKWFETDDRADRGGNAVVNN